MDVVIDHLVSSQSIAIPLPSGRADSVSVVDLAKGLLLYQQWTVEQASVRHLWHAMEGISPTCRYTFYLMNDTLAIA